MLAEAFAHAYVQNALAAGILVALLSTFVGYFVVLRGAAFATHALAQIGFAGAAGAVLVGVEPLAGLIVFALAGALGIGAFARRSRSHDVGTALVLVAALGTGALFLALAHAFASDVFSLLFGTIVGVDRAAVVVTALATLVALTLLGVLARPLLFATVARETALTRGVPVGALDLAFLAIVGLTAAVIVPIVGTLLIYSLTVGPTAAAARVTSSPLGTLALGALLAVSAVLVGIVLAYATDWPVGFFIASTTALEYVVARFAGVRLRRSAPVRS